MKPWWLHVYITLWRIKCIHSQKWSTARLNHLIIWPPWPFSSLQSSVVVYCVVLHNYYLNEHKMDLDHMILECTTTIDFHYLRNTDRPNNYTLIWYTLYVHTKITWNIFYVHFCHLIHILIMVIYITVSLIYLADILSLCVLAYHKDEDFYNWDSVAMGIHHTRSVVFFLLVSVSRLHLKYISKPELSTNI